MPRTAIGTGIGRLRQLRLLTISRAAIAHSTNGKARSVAAASQNGINVEKRHARRCDEVMAGLNLVEIEEVIEVIRKVRDGGISILVIEHVIKAIKSLSDRLLVLHHGEKIAEGEPSLDISAKPDEIQLSARLLAGLRQLDLPASAPKEGAYCDVVENRQAGKRPHDLKCASYTEPCATICGHTSKRPSFKKDVPRTWGQRPADQAD